MKRASLVLVPSLVALATASGCRCGRDDERPYTPFQLASSSPPAPTAVPTGGVADAGASQRRGFRRTSARPLEPPVPESTLGDVPLAAPDGWLIERVLAWQSPASEKPQAALAWLVPAKQEDGRGPGTLYWFHAGEKPRRLLSFPGFVPTAPGCTHRIALIRTGPNTATLDVAAECENQKLAARLPVRSLTVIAPERAHPKVFGLRLSKPGSDEKLRVEVHSDDLDADGHDDVKVSLLLRAGRDTKESSADVIWLDRASGPARDFTEPAKSLGEIGSIESVRAKGAGTSEHTPKRIENARRLMHYLCAGTGSNGVTDEEGVAIDCGDLSRARSLFTLADVQARITRGLLGDAVFAYESRNWYGSIDAATETELETLLTKHIRSLGAQTTRVDARPRDPGPGAAFSPLAFGAGGALLIQTATGILRYRDGELDDASDEIDPWALLPKGPISETFVGVVFPCDRQFVELQARTPAGVFSTVADAQRLAPRPGMCLGKATFWTPEFSPVRWDKSGLAGLLGSSWIGSQRALEAPSLGSPVSANGMHWVAATSLGLFVQHETDAELWRADATELAPERCVIDDAGKRAACVEGHEVVVLSAASSGSEVVSPAP